MLLDVDNNVPDVAAVYQSTVKPLEVEALITTFPVPQMELFVPVGADGAERTAAIDSDRRMETQPEFKFLAAA